MNLHCTNCSTAMVIMGQGEPLHCMTCGMDGPTLTTPPNTRKPLMYTARYGGVSPNLVEATVTYHLVPGKKNGVPGVESWCPWCGSVCQVDDWTRPRGSAKTDTTRELQCECGVGHRYVIVCTEVGDYYWR